MVIALSGSFQTTPAFWLNWKNGVNYSLIAQSPQYSISSIDDIENLSITGSKILVKAKKGSAIDLEIPYGAASK